MIYALFFFLGFSLCSLVWSFAETAGKKKAPDSCESGARLPAKGENDAG